MTSKLNHTINEDLLKLLIENCFDGMSESIKILLNEAMKLERTNHLRANKYERTEERNGYASGYKPKTIKTRLGSIELSVPQVRESSKPFYPKCIEKGCRSERALKVAVAEMYIQGVSTRKVEAITKKLCGIDFSSSDVSRISKVLDDELEKFRNRQLGITPYVFLDAHYQKVRYQGSVQSIAVLSAIAYNETGHREVLGTSVSFSEAEVHWRTFLEKLLSRGLKGVQLFVSDDHAGLRKARQSVFPSVKWQRCQFHMAQNAQAYVPKKDMKKEIAEAVRNIFNCPTEETARAETKKVEDKFEKTAPEFVNWLSENIEEGLVCLCFPAAHQKKIRTVNCLERTHREIRRRTKVVTLFPNKESCLRLVTALLLEKHEDWSNSRAMLNMKHLYDPDKIEAEDILRGIV